jgi:hypothetical protein
VAQQLQLDTFTGPHPTNHDFVQRLHDWGFTTRRTEGVHLVLRAPHGGTIRILRSLLGRADAQLVTKAARLVGVTTDRFWAGPSSPTSPPPPASPASAPAPMPRHPSPAARDQLTALVLAAHTRADRPLGFNDVVELCRGQVTRAQVSHASAALCRDGDLDRIRTGVYQWAAGTRAAAQATAAPHSATVATAPTPSQPAQSAQAAAGTATTELFNQLFPRGVQMTADLLADFEQWTQLTERLAAHANAS